MNQTSRTICLLACIVMTRVVSGVAGAASQGPDRPASEKTVTRDTTFSIPFFLNPKSQPPTQVYLFVSNDQGQHWSNYQQRPPQQGKFDFRASRDGEYWFVVRTNFDREAPNDATRAEKIVIVDSVAPQIALTVRQDGPSGVAAQWRAEDATLDSASLRLEYRLNETAPWQHVPISLTSPLDSNRSSAGSAGETTWVVSEPTSKIQVRATVADRSGNIQTQLETLELSPQPLAAQPTLIDEQPAWASDRGPTVPPAGPATTLTESRPDRWQPTGLGNLDGPSAPTERWMTPEPEAQIQDVPPPTALGTAPTENTPLAPVVTPSLDRAPTELPAADRLAADPYQPPVADQHGPESEAPGAETQITRSLQFNLDYEVEDLGNAQVDRVELWLTTDDGRTWQASGLDQDLTSPMLVKLDHEGTFGFRLLVYNDRREHRRPPQPGEAPELTVTVDQTAPFLKLIGAELVPQGDSPTVKIKWQAHDEHFGPQPIRLSYASTPQGPWITLADALPNSGEHQWQPENRLPRSTYIRVEATDRAGNISIASTEHPLGQQGAEPRAVIRGVRTVGDVPTR